MTLNPTQPNPPPMTKFLERKPYGMSSLLNQLLEECAGRMGPPGKSPHAEGLLNYPLNACVTVREVGISAGDISCP